MTMELKGKENIPALKEVFKGKFLVGAAVAYDQAIGVNPEETALIASQFNTITPENCLKWSIVQDSPGRYVFTRADKFVEFGEKHGMFIVGHILVDTVMVPEWVFRGTDGGKADRDTVLRRMEDHIATVVGRYRGRIRAWQVVNEAIGRDGLPVRTMWYEAVGEDYIRKAFEFAHRSDPEAELYYNGHDMLTAEATDAIVRLVKDIKERGGRIDGVGVQAHWNLETPSAGEVDEGIKRLLKSGVKVMITEMDITVLPGNNGNLDPYREGLPEDVQEKLARRYADLYSVFLRYAGRLDRVNLWGVHDGQSWLNYWPVRGRTDYPLLFGRDLKPKPAFFAVVGAALRSVKEKNGS